MTASGAGDLPVTAAATFCATLVDEWVRGGVTDAVVCPGSRSTPMALALADAAADGRLALHVHHDERAAAFVALGLGLATGRPAPILVTSGTAAVELHPAVVEAHQAKVPLLALTADRPPELHDVGAPQTIDQVRLYGTAARWFADPGVPDQSDADGWRPLAARCLAAATGSPPGPVQLNLAFREPLLGRPGPLPSPRGAGGPWFQAAPTGPPATPGLEEQTVEALAGALGAGGSSWSPVRASTTPTPSTSWPGSPAGRCWPTRGGTRTPAPATIAHADALLRHRAFAASVRPEAVLRLGALPASKVVVQWLAGLGPDVWQVGVDVDGTLHDPDGSLASVLRAPPGALCGALLDRVKATFEAEGWLERWVRADAEAAAAVREVLAGHHEATEPATARDVLAALPDGAALVASSSMPVRELEWFGVPRDGVRVLANRGANGIDGVVSTAVGVALAQQRRAAHTAVLVGDVAFVHDTNALVGLAARGVDLVVVVVDNDGGGIFELLPPARALGRDRFERLFATPYVADLAGLAAAHGVATVRVERRDEVGPAVARAVARGGPQVVLVPTDRRANAALHDELHAAVAAALDRAGLCG
ncbi:MAG: 2-succinyl-5-enolpyruvyl-6-hydroxy-3-cyclohexene-1-carboxylic-acid synthase [Acidimicrobiales bacterium]